MKLDGKAVVAIIVAAVLGLAGGIGWSLVSQRVPHSASAAEAPDAAWPAAGMMPPAESFEPVFQPCAHCHQVGPGARHATGPELNSIVGRAAAGRDYPYSDAMRNSGLVWDTPTLTAFLTAPQAVVPGTRMMLEGLSEQDARRVVAYLASLDTGGARNGGGQQEGQ